jgi:hypothetical protein
MSKLNLLRDFAIAVLASIVANVATAWLMNL